MTTQTTQTIIPEGSSYTASIWIFQTCSSGRWDAGCRRRTYLWGPHHDRWSQQLNYISIMVGCFQLSCLPERYCYSVDQLLLLRIQHWGRGGVSPSKHARSSATLFDGKGARSFCFSQNLLMLERLSPRFSRNCRGIMKLYISCGATKKSVLFIKLQDYIIIIFMLGLWAYSIHLILRWLLYIFVVCWYHSLSLHLNSTRTTFFPKNIDR